MLQLISVFVFLSIPWYTFSTLPNSNSHLLVFVHAVRWSKCSSSTCSFPLCPFLGPQRFPPLLVIYCCTRNYYPKTWWLEITCIILYFLKFHDSDMAYLESLLRLSPRLQLRAAGAIVSSRGSNGEVALPGFLCGSLQDPAPYRLLIWQPKLFSVCWSDATLSSLTPWASPTWQELFVCLLIKVYKLRKNREQQQDQSYSLLWSNYTSKISSLNLMLLASH